MPFVRDKSNSLNEVDSDMADLVGLFVRNKDNQC